MSDAWAPVHHEEMDTDEPGSTADPQHEGGGARKTGAARTGDKKQAESPVGLTLALPQDMIDAMWGAADQLKRVALAIEENSTLTRRLIDLLTGGKDEDKSGASG